MHRYLRAQRDALLSKLDGVSEYDVRRPHVPTGSNLLGIVKHVAFVQMGYLGDVFGRPAGIPSPWETSPDDPNATVDALAIDAVGEVPWWPEDRRHPTLHQVMVHLLVDVARHAGHADIIREQIDGTVGYVPGNSNMPDRDEASWATHRDRVEAAARAAAGMPPE